MYCHTKIREQLNSQILVISNLSTHSTSLKIKDMAKLNVACSCKSQTHSCAPTTDNPESEVNNEASKRQLISLRTAELENALSESHSNTPLLIRRPTFPLHAVIEGARARELVAEALLCECRGLIGDLLSST